MSRIGKKPIEIPTGVELRINGQEVVVKGPKGELKQEILPQVLVEQKDNKIQVSLTNKDKKNYRFWGLFRTLLQNMVEGVVNGFEKKLEIIGVGYKAFLEGDKILVLELGFSHPVKIDIPENIKVSVEKNVIKISAVDKQKVGEFSAKIRDIKKPEPYKGKGIRYQGEKVRRKEGKKTATAAA